MTWIAGIITAIGKVFASVALFVSLIFPRMGSMDSAVRDMTADMAAFQRMQTVLAADPALRWVEPDPGMRELFEPPNPFVVTDATRARYRDLGVFLRAHGFRDIVTAREDGKLKSFRLVMVDEGYFGRQKLVEGVWLADGEPIGSYAMRAQCRAVRAPHWHVCQLN